MISSLQNAVIALRDRLENDMPLMLIHVATSTTSEVANRSIKEGILVNAEAGNKAEYSSKKAPTYLLWNKARNESGRKYIKENKYGNWAGFRAAQGLESAFVNLFYTGRFWASIQAGVVGRTARGFSVEYTVTDSAVARYAGYLVERYGEFYKPTEAEEREAGDEIKDLLERTVKQYV